MRRLWLALALPLLAAHGAAVQAQQGVEAPPILGPVASLIIDDLGDRLQDGLRAIDLPGAVTYSVLPQTTYSRRLAESAHRAGKEVMMHQPMEALSDVRMGPGGLSLQMPYRLFIETLRANLASVPHARGVNNHMGSLLTRYPDRMNWFMYELGHHGGLFFVDSITSTETVALKVAMQHNLPSLRRNIFIDHERSDGAIRHQFARFVAQARAAGTSLAIAHPYPETLQVLEELLPTLAEQGVELLPVSELIGQRNIRREQLWQASLSHSQKGAKSSKQ